MSQRYKFDFLYLSFVFEAQQTRRIGISIGIGIDRRLEYSVLVAKRGIVLTLLSKIETICSLCEASVKAHCETSTDLLRNHRSFAVSENLK